LKREFNSMWNCVDPSPCSFPLKKADFSLPRQPAICFFFGTWSGASPHPSMFRLPGGAVSPGWQELPLSTDVSATLVFLGQSAADLFDYILNMYLFCFQNCASHYSEMLEKVNTPKRKRTSEGGGTGKNLFFFFFFFAYCFLFQKI